MRNIPQISKMTLQVFCGLLLLASNLYATGVLDENFGTNGRVVTDFGSDSQIRAIAIQPDGKIVAVGTVRDAANLTDFALARYNSDGTLDTSFGAAGKVVTALSEGDDRTEAVALQADGKIVVVGRKAANAENQSFDFAVVRYNADGTLDADFGQGGIVAYDQAVLDTFYSVMVRPDGSIVAAGDYGLYQPIIVSLKPDGTLNSRFANGGILYPAIPNLPIWTLPSLGQQANGNIIVGGTIIPRGKIMRLIAVIALNDKGEFVPEFGENGLAAANGGLESNAVTDLIVQPDGQIYTVGQVSARFSANGIYEGTFLGGRNGDVATLSNGYIVSSSSGFVTVASNELVTLNTAGGRQIGRGSLRITQVNDLAAQADNKIVSAGMTHVNPNNTGQRNFVLIRYRAITSSATRIADFDADERTDISVFRPETAEFFALQSSAGFAQRNAGSDNPFRFIPEDYTGDRRSEYALWENTANASSFVYYTINGNLVRFEWGLPAVDRPVGGDYDGDGRTDYAVFRAGEFSWYINLSSNGGFRAVSFGQPNDVPVPADYDYDGLTDVAVYRPSDGTWYVLASADNSVKALQFGANTDVPVTGDYDGDGRADYVVFRPDNGTWYQLNSTEGFRAVQFGAANDKPVPGDYDGDGKHDIGVFRDGNWYLLQTSQGFSAVQWGLPTDVPIAVRY
jgi:uncharacterized delta-60 repeat protein